MRAFIALPLSAEINSALKDFMMELGDVKGIRMVPPENLHLTLDFLGEISERDVPFLREKLTAVAANTPSFPLSVCGVGAFPKSGDPKVLWVGLKRSTALMALASAVKEATGSNDGKRFSPHLTMGRVKYAEAKQRKFLEQFFQAEHRHFGRMNVDRFLLMQSDLSGKAPVYTAISQFELKDGEKNGEKNG